MFYLEKTIKEKYVESFGSRSENLVKLSLDFPVINTKRIDYGKATETRELQRMIRKLGDLDSSWRVSEMGFFAEKSFNGAQVRVGSDFRSSIIEVKLPFSNTLDGLAKNIVEVMGPIALAAERTGLGILAYGTEPLSKVNEKLIINNSKNTILRAKLNDRMPYLGLVASEKVHIRASAEEMPVVNNVLNAYSPAVISLTGNASVIRARDIGFADYRGIVTDMVDFTGRANREENKGRRGMMVPFSSIEEYYEFMLDFKPILTVREGKPMTYLGIHSFRDFIKKGSAEAEMVCNGKKTRILPDIKDFYYHERTSWTDARPRGDYGTVELASACMQSSVQEIIAVSALAVGLAANANEAWEHVSKYDREELSRMRRRAMTYGLSCDMLEDPVDRKLEAYALYFAERGLVKIGERADYLDPLYINLEEFRNPGQRSAEQIRRKGFSAFMEARRVKAE